MDARRYAYCTPRRRDPSIAEEPAITFSSCYIQRASDILPKQGSKKPWKLHQNYALDLLDLRFARVDDGTMEFARLEQKARAVEAAGKTARARRVASSRSGE
jgi:monooxygenase